MTKSHIDLWLKHTYIKPKCGPNGIIYILKTEISIVSSCKNRCQTANWADQSKVPKTIGIFESCPLLPMRIKRMAHNTFKYTQKVLYK